MSVAVIAKNPSKDLAEHLALQVKLLERRGDFDMNDEPETEVLAPFPEFKADLDWLESRLGKRWRTSDREALNCQRQHRRLARLAIGAGTFAIVSAVLQLAIKLTMPGLAGLALAFEAIAIAAAVIAVAVGLWAKFDRRWLGQRHLAERLRMLKFRALEQLWCFDQASWRQWVEGQLISLEGGADNKKIEEWSTEELIEPYPVASLGCTPDPGLIQALAIYYRFKRVEFQAEYFDRRRRDFTRQTGHWLHLGLPLFLASVFCVILHFLLEYLAGGNRPRYESPPRLEFFAIWFLALAAIIPVFGLCLRAWFAAFELPRSANLFGAKYRALRHLTTQLEQDSGDALRTLHHLAQAEYFLEHEHREWLRLLWDTEWFL